MSSENRRSAGIVNAASVSGRVALLLLGLCWLMPGCAGTPPPRHDIASVLAGMEDDTATYERPGPLRPVREEPVVRLRNSPREKPPAVRSEPKPSDDSASPNPAQLSFADERVEEYRILPLDIIQISVYGETDISGEFQVAGDGTITHPLLGSVGVAHLTVHDAEKKLINLLAKDYLVNPRVTVSVVKSSTRRIIVFGEVKSPGFYSVPPDQPMTLLKLISLAGGFTDIAATTRVRIVRRHNGKDETLRINVNDLLEGRDGKSDIPLRPGDVITVPETMF